MALNYGTGLNATWMKKKITRAITCIEDWVEKSDRLTMRNGPPIGTTGVNWGRLAELRKYHPEVWQQFVEKFPLVRDYG